MRPSFFFRLCAVFHSLSTLLLKERIHYFLMEPLHRRNPVEWTSTKRGETAVAELETHVNEIIGRQAPETLTSSNVLQDSKSELNTEPNPEPELQWKVNVSEQVMSSLLDMSDDKRQDFYKALGSIIQNPEGHGEPLEEVDIVDEIEDETEL
jgi:hypothetical protein